MRLHVGEQEERRHVSKRYAKAQDMLRRGTGTPNIRDYIIVFAESVSPEAADTRPAHPPSAGGLEQKYVGSVRTKCTSKSVPPKCLSQVHRTYKALCRTHASSGAAGGGDRRESVGGHGDRPSGEGREHGCLKVPRRNDESRQRKASRQFCAEVSY